MTEIRINKKLFAKHDGMWLILENNAFDLIDTNHKNIIEIVSEEIKIKGEMIAMTFENQKSVLEFHIKTKYLEDITFSIEIAYNLHAKRGGRK